ncbi:MAG: LssY C-terminal domain-containing protein, partial [Chloroflexi bacterium]|nr:LssY C-terminal domain-containing protein [Chloroflexota bacterium]
MRSGATTTATLLLVALLLAQATPAQGGKARLTLDDFASRLPTRVTDHEGTPGDMVNFVLIGSREQVIAALEAAGWEPVDRSTSEAILTAILVTLDKKVYVTLPMSELFLFDRAQDFGYARGDPIRVVAERHHFRLWEAPWQTEDGQDIWLGAGTYDAGLEEH